MVPSQKKPKFSDSFLAIAGGKALIFPHSFDAGTQDGLPFTCPGDLVARGAASPWQIDDGFGVNRQSRFGRPLQGGPSSKVVCTLTVGGAARGFSMKRLVRRPPAIPRELDRSEGVGSPVQTTIPAARSNSHPGGMVAPPPGSGARWLAMPCLRRPASSDTIVHMIIVGETTPLTISAPVVVATRCEAVTD